MTYYQGTNYVNIDTLQLQFVVFSKRNITGIVALSSFSVKPCTSASTNNPTEFLCSSKKGPC